MTSCDAQSRLIDTPVWRSICWETHSFLHWVANLRVSNRFGLLQSCASPQARHQRPLMLFSFFFPHGGPTKTAESLPQGTSCQERRAKRHQLQQTRKRRRRKNLEGLLKRNLEIEKGQPDRNARGWKSEGERKRVTRKECKRLRGDFEDGGFMAQKEV